MSETLQFRRGDTAKTDAFTGAAGEITVDTDKKVAVVHDGSAPGGFPLLRDDLANAAPVAADLIPDQDGTRSLGSATTAWKEGHFDALTVGTLNASALTGATPTNVAGTMMVLVSEQVLTSPATTLSFAGLDGDADTEYEIVATMVSNTATATYMLLRPNGDATAANYRTSMVYSITSSTAAGFYDTALSGWRLAYTNTNGQISSGRFTILAKTGTIRSYVGEYIQAVSATANGNMFAVGGEWSNTAANITSFTLVADNGSGTPVANGFGVGTRIALYARKRVGGTASNVSANFRGALLKRSAGTSIPNGTWTTVAWDSAQYDTDGFFTAGSPTRLTVPAGVNKVRLTSGISVLGSGIHTRISRNGSQVYPAPYNFNTNATPMDLSTAVFPVQAGDYFTVDVYHSSGSAQVLNNPEFCYFGLEVVDPVPVAVSGFGSNTTTDYALLTMSANQTSNLSAGGTIAFDSLTGNMTRNGNGITLKAGKTYKLSAQVYFGGSSNNAYLDYQFHDGTAFVGPKAENLAITYSSILGQLPLVTTVVTPMVDTTYTLRIAANSGGTNLVNLIYGSPFSTFMMAEQIGGPANGLNYGPAGYGQLTMGASTAVSSTAGTIVPFNTITGNLSLNGNGVVLKAGRAYLLQAGLYFDAPASSSTYLDYRFHNGTTWIGTGGEVIAISYPSNTGSQDKAVAIYKPSVDTTVSLRVVGGAGSPTVNAAYSYFTVVELAAAVDTYATTETLTDKLWIDGKPVYRKVLNLGALPNNTTATVAHSITGLTEIVDFRGWAKNSAGNRIPLPYPHPSAPNSVTVNVNATSVSVYTLADWSGYSGYLTLEYTK